MSFCYIEDAERIDAIRKQRFQLIRFEQLRPNPAPPYLIKALIPRVGLVVVWGAPKSGKSFWTMDAMLHVAHGKDYRGRKVNQGPVVYCAFEGGDGYGKRAEAFRRQYDAWDRNPPFFLISTRLNLVKDHEELIGDIRRVLEPESPVAVVLDTLNRSLHGSESNDEDMAAYIRSADAVREKLNCVVVVVHHCGVDGTRPRGHTSLTGAVDLQLAVRRAPGGEVVTTVEAQKDGPEGDKFSSRLETVQIGIDEDGEPITSCVVIAAAAGAQEETKSARATRMPRGPAMALRALREIISEAGDVPPPSNRIPADIRATTVDRWREHCYRLGISGSDQARARQLAFQRAFDVLNESGQVSVWDGWVWLTAKGANMRTPS